MRNLKRALSLTLASVMLLGMMVVGSSAAAGYSDVAETDNVEAIEVLQAIGVMVGDDNGFRPGDSVNRAEMAVVMAKLLNLDYNYYTATCPFDDVYDWARGYVGACYANGIVSGRGEGVYDPGTTVTAVEAASMMLRALGYFKYQSDYADGFEVATVREGTKVGIFKGVGSSANTPLTRNQVAQMALNALKSGVVEPDGNTINMTTPDGSVITSKVNYVKVTSTQTYAQAISKVQATSIGSANDGYIVELGERLYNGDLKLNDSNLDVFQRPARTWEFKGKEIGTYVKKELLKQSYTTKVTGKDLYELLTASTIKDYDAVIAIDGETEERVLTGYGYFTPANLIRSNTEAVGKTGNGVITEVYVDSLNEIYYISVINTYLAKASGDYNEKRDEAKFNVWGLEKRSSYDNVLVKNTSNAVSNPTITLTTEDFNVDGVKDGDIYLVHVADGTIQVMMAPEVIDNTKLTSFKKGSWVVADGTKYDYNNAIEYDAEVLDAYDDFNMKDTTYRVYLDANGYALGLAIVEATEQYLFLTGLEYNGSNLYNKQADANAIFLDGTVKTIKVNMSKSETSSGADLAHNAVYNTWCTYSENSDGTYTLTQVADNNNDYTRDSNGVLYTGGKTDKLGQGRDYDLISNGANPPVQINNTTPNEQYKKIDTKNWYLNGIAGSDEKTVYGNDDSVYLAASVKKLTTTLNPGTHTAVVIDDVSSVSTGIQSTSMYAWNAAKAAAAAGWTITADQYQDDNLNLVSSGVYTLFKDNGYVIAAVVVGEDDGTSSQYAFVHSSDVKQEDWTVTAAKGEDGIYTWYRDVILDGEETTLIEKTNDRPEIRTMSQGSWYKVKFNADGTVRKVEAVAYGQNDTGLNNITKLHDKVNGLNGYTAASTVILADGSLNVNGKGVSYTGSTLQFETSVGVTSYGFPVFADAKIVLIQDKMIDNDVNNVKTMDIVTSYVGANGLKEAISHLNNKGNFKGSINAIIKDGRATAVVICETNATNVNTGGQWNKSHYDITFSTADYNTNWYDIYVGDSATPLTSNDFTATGINRTFRVRAGETVMVVAKNYWAGTFPNAGYVNAGIYKGTANVVIGTVNSNKTVLSFLADGDIILGGTLANVPVVTPDIAEGLKNNFRMPKEGQKIDATGGTVSFDIYDNNAGANLGRARAAATEFVRGNTYQVTYTVGSGASATVSAVCETNGKITVVVTGLSISAGQAVTVNVSAIDDQGVQDTALTGVEVTLAAPTAGQALPEATTTEQNVTVTTTWVDDQGVEATTATDGETYTATVTVTANSGYTLDEAELTITANGYTDNDDGTYTITVAAGTTAELATLKVNGSDATVNDTTATATIPTIEKGAQVTIVGTATNNGTVEVSPASPWTVPENAADGTQQVFTVTVKNADTTVAKEITLTVTLTAVTDPAPALPTVEETAGEDAVPGFTAGTPQDGTPVEGAAALDLSGDQAIADASAVTSETSLDVGGVTVNLSSLQVDGKTPAEIFAAIEEAVKAAVETANGNGANGTQTYTEVTVEDGAVTANSNTGFQIAFKTTEMTYDANKTPATAFKAAVDFTDLTGADLEGVTVTVGSTVFEFVLTGGSATGGNTAVTVAEDAVASAIASAFASAVSSASVSGVSTAAANGAVVTITTTATGAAATLTVEVTAAS